jgi:hypothetical protein
MKVARYKLKGIVTVTTWYGRKGWVKLTIDTDEDGLREIKEEPRQDYLRFGVQSVDYARFDVYPYEIATEGIHRVTTECLKPSKIIEAGKWTLPQREEEVLMDDCNIVEITR